MQKEPSKHMKKTLFSFVVLSVFVFSRFAKAQFAPSQMYPQQQYQRMPNMMDAQAAQMQMGQMQMGQMQMMGQGGMMPPGFVGQIPGSYNDANCLNGSMMMPQAPITPAYYDQQQRMMMGH